MKNTLRFFLIFLGIIILSTPLFADRSEKARVIFVDSENHDLIVERLNGERYLVQHHYTCSSMSTEFPVTLIWEGDKMTKLKVAFNEICKVHNYGYYTGEVNFEKRIKSNNLLVKEHEGEILFENKKYRIDYGPGCEQMRDFEGKKLHIYMPSTEPEGATIYLPDHRGQCTINSAELLETLEVEKSSLPALQNIQYRAENNQVYFYWDEPKETEVLNYIIAYSKYEFNPEDYNYRKLPGVRFTRNNSYTMQRLANDQEYHFYLAMMDKDINIGPWHHIALKPVNTNPKIENNPDPEKFEIKLKEDGEDHWTWTWPDKSDQARRYIINFYVDGKPALLKFLKTDKAEFRLEKLPKYLGNKYKFTVKTLPIKYKPTYNDGIYWEENK